jgi:hypothetical protein
LDQISILRNPATADLKQDQYSTILVQSAVILVLLFTTLLSAAWAHSSISALSF